VLKMGCRPQDNIFARYDVSQGGIGAIENIDRVFVIYNVVKREGEKK
jgi:hypothetical protein